MRNIALGFLSLAAVPILCSAKELGFLEIPLDYNGQFYTVSIEFANLTSQFTMGSKNFSVSLLPLFGADYTAVADDTCEDCEIKGYNATESRADGFCLNSTDNGLSKEVNVSFFYNGYTLWGAPNKDTVCMA
jgi:hypothetical protein